MEKYYEYDKELFMNFVYIKQAYDKINKQQLWTALRNFAIPEKLAKIVEIYVCRVRYKWEMALQYEVQLD